MLGDQLFTASAAPQSRGCTGMAESGVRMPTATVIRTARLTLVPLAVGHAEQMATVLASPSIHDFIGGSPSTAAELRSRYERLVAGSGDPAVTWLNWVIRLREPGRSVPHGPLTGTVQATVTGGPACCQAEVAWVVGVAWQRKGIAKEAARALVVWLQQQGVRTVIAHIHPGHFASAAVAMSTGLRPTGDTHDGEIRWQLGPAG